MTLQEFKDVATKYGIVCETCDVSTYYLVPNSYYPMITYYSGRFILVRTLYHCESGGKIVPNNYLKQLPIDVSLNDFEKYVVFSLQNYKEALIDSKKEQLEEDFYA